MTKSSGVTIMRIGISKIFILTFILVLFMNIVGATSILEPGFETVNNWSFTNNGGVSGGTSTFWTTEGTYSYEFVRGAEVDGVNASISQYIEPSPRIKKIVFDARTYCTLSGSPCEAGYESGNTYLYGEVKLNNISKMTFLSSITTYLDNELDLSNYSSFNLQLFAVHRVTSSLVNYVYFDNIRSILNNISTIPIISSPVNGSRHYNNSIDFIWNISTDIDNDSISYDFWLSSQPDFSNAINRTNITHDAIISQSLSDVNNVLQYGQTFTTDATQDDIENITVWTDTFGYPETWYNLTVWNSPSKTTPIGSKNISFVYSTARWVNFSFDVPLNVSPSTQYYFEVIKGPSGSYGHSYTSYDSYTGGDYYREGVLISGSDIKFMVYDSKIRINNVITSDGITYYGRVRSNDTYDHSNWSNTTQFTENSLPSISDPNFLQPPSPTVTTNLTLSLNITTDPEGDTIANHTLWYINDVLNTSYNDSLFLNYSNFTLGDSVYVKAYLRDGYENTSLTTSNSVIIGSQNSAPSISSITLNPTIRKYNKSVWINSSNITDSESSYIRLLTYYKLSNESKVYLNNSTWYAPPTIINVTFNSPWNDSNSHYIYAQVEDSGNISGFYNLTSGEVQATLTGDITAPAVSTSSLSASSIYTGNHVTINMTTSLSNGTTSNVSVIVSRPDATSAAYAMSTVDNISWSYTYTQTANVGSYYIEYFSMTDDSGNRRTETSTLTFVASTAPTGSTGGGGGGGSTIIVVKETDNGTQEVLFTNITSIESLKDLTTLGLCFDDSLMLSNKCAQASISIVDSPTNWWVLFGSYLGSMITLFIISIATDTKKRFAENILFFGTVAWVSVILLTFMGVNLFIINYIFNSPLPGFMFLSFVMWGSITTIVGDRYSKRNLK